MLRLQYTTSIQRPRTSFHFKARKEEREEEEEEEEEEERKRERKTMKKGIRDVLAIALVFISCNYCDVFCLSSHLDERMNITNC